MTADSDNSQQVYVCSNTRCLAIYAVEHQDCKICAAAGMRCTLVRRDVLDKPSAAEVMVKLSNEITEARHERNQAWKERDDLLEFKAYCFQRLYGMGVPVWPDRKGTEGAHGIGDLFDYAHKIMADRDRANKERKACEDSWHEEGGAKEKAVAEIRSLERSLSVVQSQLDKRTAERDCLEEKLAAAINRAAEREAQREEQVKLVPPPLGIMPQDIWVERRILDLAAAIGRYQASLLQNAPEGRAAVMAAIREWSAEIVFLGQGDLVKQRKP